MYLYVSVYLFVWFSVLAIKPKTLRPLYTCLTMELSHSLHFWRGVKIFIHNLGTLEIYLSISQKTDRYSTRHGVCGLRKSRHGALLGQLPFLASPIGRPQGSKVQVTPGKSAAGCQVRLCSAWASQRFITRESEGVPRQPQVGNTGQNLSALQQLGSVLECVEDMTYLPMSVIMG